MKKAKLKLNQLSTKVLEQMLTSAEGKQKVKLLKALGKRNVLVEF